MSPLTLLVLRRLAVFSLLLAGLLFLIFRILPAYGLMGPSLAEEVESATRAVEAARRYGAADDLAPFRSAQQRLARARELGAQGQEREGRRAAQAARRDAIDAQRMALSQRQTRRREAERVTLEIDRRLSELERLYSEVIPGLPKDEVSRLLSAMKHARRTGAGLYLAYEGDDVNLVLGEQAAAIEVLKATRSTLIAARSLPRGVAKKGKGRGAAK